MYHFTKCSNTGADPGFSERGGTTENVTQQSKANEAL